MSGQAPELTGYFCHTLLIGGWQKLSHPALDPPASALGFGDEGRSGEGCLWSWGAAVATPCRECGHRGGTPRSGISGNVAESG